MLGTRTRGGMMEGTDESTVLWRHPMRVLFCIEQICAPILVIFHAFWHWCKWPNFEQIILPSGHTAVLSIKTIQAPSSSSNHISSNFRPFSKMENDIFSPAKNAFWNTPSKDNTIFASNSKLLGRSILGKRRGRHSQFMKGPFRALYGYDVVTCTELLLACSRKK